VPLTEEEKSDCRHHLGYVEVSEVATFSLGIPAALQTQFMIEQAMNLLTNSGEARVRRCLRILNRIEELELESLEDVEVEQIGEITINKDFYRTRRRQYRLWQGALGNCFGVPVMPFDQRNGAMAGINVRVRS
jgi:hypothetical protein